MELSCSHFPQPNYPAQSGDAPSPHPHPNPTHPLALNAPPPPPSHLCDQLDGDVRVIVKGEVKAEQGADRGLGLGEGRTDTPLLVDAQLAEGLHRAFHRG